MFRRRDGIPRTSGGMPVYQLYFLGAINISRDELPGVESYLSQECTHYVLIPAEGYNRAWVCVYGEYGSLVFSALRHRFTPPPVAYDMAVVWREKK